MEEERRGKLHLVCQNLPLGRGGGGRIRHTCRPWFLCRPPERDGAHPLRSVDPPSPPVSDSGYHGDSAHPGRSGRQKKCEPCCDIRRERPVAASTGWFLPRLLLVNYPARFQLDPPGLWW